MGFNMLGQVTNAYEKWIYHRGKLDSPEALHLLGLHHYLIDADKQGLEFGNDGWRKFRQRHKIAEMAAPAHKLFTAKDRERPAGKTSKPLPRTDSITDHVFFNVLQPILDDAIAKVKSVASRSELDDPDLSQVREVILHNSPSADAVREIDALPTRLTAVVDSRKQYACEFYGRDSVCDYRRWAEGTLRPTRAIFDSLAPLNPTTATARAWLLKCGAEPTLWDKLKASMLFGHPEGKSIAFETAGYELGTMKAQAEHRGRTVELGSYMGLKVRGAGARAKETTEPDVDMTDTEYVNRSFSCGEFFSYGVLGLRICM